MVNLMRTLATRFLLTLLCCLLPTFAAAATNQTIHAEWSAYTPPDGLTVTGFKLYQEGTFACLNNVPAADGYRPTRRMRKALRLLRPTEAFPFSTRTRRLDIDHNTTYQPGRPGQTRLDNLAQLCRRVHRGKTKGAWVLNQITPGHFRWTSPLGYVYEVTSGGTWLDCTPDLAPHLSPVDKTIQDWCDTIADATDLARVRLTPNSSSFLRFAQGTSTGSATRFSEAHPAPDAVPPPHFPAQQCVCQVGCNMRTAPPK